MVNFTSAAKAISSATTNGVKSAASAAGVALEFYAHNLEVQNHGLTKKYCESAKIHCRDELVETPDAVQMTIFNHRKSLKNGSTDEKGAYKPTRKAHRCPNPAVCVVCKNTFKNLRRNAENNNALEPRIVVDETRLDTWIPMGHSEDAMNARDEPNVGDNVTGSDGWETIAVHGTNEPSSTPVTSSSNALDNATLAHDGLVYRGDGEEELREVLVLSRNNSKASDDSISDPPTPREPHSPPKSIIRPDTINSTDEFETISLGQAAKPATNITSTEPHGLDTASLHRDMRSLRSAHATLMNYTSTTATTRSTQLNKSTNTSLYTQFFSGLHSRLSASDSTPVITASTAIIPLLTTMSHTHTGHQAEITPPESSYSIIRPIILSPENCKSLHTFSTTFHSDPLPCRFTHDSSLTSISFLDSSSTWMSSSTFGQKADFCAHSVIRNAQDARDEEIGVLEMKAMRKGPSRQEKKQSLSGPGQEQRDMNRDRHRLRKAKGLDPEPVMAQEVFGRLF